MTDYLILDPSQADAPMTFTLTYLESLVLLTWLAWLLKDGSNLKNVERDIRPIFQKLDEQFSKQPISKESAK